jgi:hypothetical protein
MVFSLKRTHNYRFRIPRRRNAIGVWIAEVVMQRHNVDQQPLEEPLAQLERQLINAYLAAAGQDFRDLIVRNDAAAHRLLAEASLYASERLSEIEARAHFLKKLHGSE